MTDTYAIHIPAQHDAVGHATSLTGAVAALAALLERPLEDLHTEQPGAFGGWLVRDAAGATVGAIALVMRRVPGAVLHCDGIESVAWSPSRSHAVGDRVTTADGTGVCTHSGLAPSSAP